MNNILKNNAITLLNILFSFQYWLFLRTSIIRSVSLLFFLTFNFFKSLFGWFNFKYILDGVLNLETSRLFSTLFGFLRVDRAIPHNAINEDRLFSPKAIFSVFLF